MNFKASEKIIKNLSAFIMVAGVFTCLAACEQKPAQDKRQTSAETPHITNAYPQEVYWGDLHVHSRFSMDSFSFGNETLSPDDAFRFAKGEAIKAHNGEMAQLKKPLDFLLVSDHAEYLGVVASIVDRKNGIENTSLGKRWKAWLDSDNLPAILNEWVGMIDNAGTGFAHADADADNDAEDNAEDNGVSLTTSVNDYPSPAFFNSVWREMTAIAERHNAPGRFTAFTGYEWTSMVEGDNLHRVVLFRDGPEVTKNLVPTSSIDSTDPEYLWARLAEYEQETGGQVMAIPHNGNVSEGRQFSDTRNSGAAFDQAYARTRIRWEPIVEITQVKGDSETHPVVSPEDEFADYESWDETDINSNPYPADQLEKIFTGSYARPTLKAGLQHEAELGVNPFKFGMIGSTDSHTVMATADDDNFFGKFVDSEPSPERLTNKMGGLLWNNRLLSASGYAAVWAEENTREALFDALKRKEVYASTGPRIVLRFFGGWDFETDDLNAADMAATGYAKGVSMGGDLSPNTAAGAPRFMITAAKDPDSANLDRLQVVKGWLQADGSVAEKVYDVRWSGEREIDPATGKLPPVGNTVNIEQASYTNDIGSEALSAVWTDPAFDPTQRAFYYVRVLEIPTPRWTTYDAKRFGLALPDDVPATHQERAYSSPIWYTP